MPDSGKSKKKGGQKQTKSKEQQQHSDDPDDEQQQGKTEVIKSLIWSLQSRGKNMNGMVLEEKRRKPNQLLILKKQVGVAAWLECWLSHLGVAGLSPGRDNLWKPLGE